MRKLSTNLLTSTASAHGSKNRWKIRRSENKTGPAKEKMRAVPASTLMKTWKRTMASMLISSSLSRYRRQQHRRHQQPHIFQKQTSTNWLEINVELFCEIISSKAKKCFKKNLRSFCGYQVRNVNLWHQNGQSRGDQLIQDCCNREGATTLEGKQQAPARRIGHDAENADERRFLIHGEVQGAQGVPHLDDLQIPLT